MFVGRHGQQFVSGCRSIEKKRKKKKKEEEEEEEEEGKRYYGRGEVD